MDKYGFIGFGSIGQMLVNSFIKSKALQSGQIMVSEVDKNKIRLLKNTWPHVEIARSLKDIATCNYIFICVKPTHACEVIISLKNKLSLSAHIINIAATVSIENIRSHFDGKITKVIPTYASEIFNGISLVCHNDRVGLEDARKIENLFNAISTVKLINEEDFELGIVLTSCGPGLIASIFDEFVKSGTKYGNLSQDEIEYLVTKTLDATAKLLYEKKISFSELIERVATPGGITEVGVNVFGEKLPDIFDKMYKDSITRYQSIHDETEKQFKGSGCEQ